jgi:hypothetical protein
VEHDEQRTEHVFLVRMWQERGADDTAWRGSVQHVATGKRLFIGSPGEAADFMSLQLRSDAGVARRSHS